MNACYAPRPDGRGVYATKALRQWKRLAINEIFAQTRGPYPIFPGAVTLNVSLPDRADRDADNCGKALCDALKKAGVIVDDCGRYVRSVLFAWANDGQADVRIQVTETGYIPAVRARKKKAGANDRVAWAQAELKKRLGVEIAAERIHF